MELSSGQNLKKHLRNVHLDPESMEITKKKMYRGHSDWKPYRSESDVGKPICKECGKEYSCARNLKIHVRSIHILKGLPTKSSVKVPLANTAERICLVCERLFHKKSDMIEHLVRHTKIYKNLKVEGKTLRSEDGTSVSCLECGKWDGKASNIKQHIAQVHFKLRDIIDFDDMESFDLSDKRTALKEYKGHSDWKPYRSESESGQPKCKECGKEYSCPRNLKIHVRSVHILKGLKPTQSSDKILVAIMADRNVENKDE